MPIDTSIYDRIQPVQVESPLNALAKVEQLRDSQNRNRLFDMQVADREGARASENALNDAYRSATGADGTIDRNKLYQSVAQSGQGAKLPGIQEGFGKADKAGYEAKKTQIETSLKTLDIVSQSLAPTLQNPALYPQVRAALMQQYPEGAANLPEQFDPNIVGSTIQKALSTKDRAEQDWKKIELDYRQKNDAANRGVTIRGQNMTDSRGRDLASATREAGGAGKPPSGYRFKQDGSGSLEAIPGGPADGKAGGMPKLTEDQGKATGWLVQATNAFSNMDNIVKTDTKATKPGFADAVASFGSEAIGNSLRSPARQKFVQASSSLSESLLRAATGAGVNESEAKQKIQELTPVFGDSKEVIKQKMDAIPLYIDSLKVRAGPGAPLAEGVVKKNSAPASNIENLLDKYK